MTCTRCLRPGVLSLGLFLLLGAGAPPARHAPAAESDPRVRVLSRGPSLAFGVEDCPSGIELELWPPNHKVVDIDLAELLGPDVLDVVIESITQDEPVEDRGDGRTQCDGDGVGTSVAHIRAERSGLRNGRVYEITYSAFGGACSGFVTVSVPHDQRGRPAKDDGQDFDSTTGCP
jgi:hypothetical protein